jgi:uncharacterized membrane protein affecting hemolysin expression
MTNPLLLLLLLLLLFLLCSSSSCLQRRHGQQVEMLKRLTVKSQSATATPCTRALLGFY